MEVFRKEVIRFSFKGFLQVLWKEKILFIIIIAIFIGLGLWYGATRREEFMSQGKILPELSGRGSRFGNLSGLASLAGIEIGGIESTEAIRPDLYPNIIESAPFFLELFKHTITTKDNKRVTFEKFYQDTFEKNTKATEKTTDKLPVSPNGYLVLSRKNEVRIKSLKSRIVVAIDKKSAVILITVKMPDPVVAAEVASFSMSYLTQYVTNYRIEKARKDMDFLAQRVNEAKGKFYSNQTKKASYSDQFQLSTIRMQSADVQRERIESEYRMSSTFYNELLKKYEEAKIKVQQETPVFKVLEPPIVPTQKSAPVKSMILLVFMAFGVIVFLIAMLIKNRNYKRVFVS